MAKQVTTLPDIRRRFEQAGFTVTGGSEPIEVAKYNCVHRIGRTSGGLWAPVSPAHFMVSGRPCELEDHGYQKFWLSSDGRRFPIKLQDLRDLQRFDQEVRYQLRLKSLYNESLGSTSARTVYDRVEGRPDA
ncbi:MAG TPA: hypothetical protein VG860_02605 [Terriglobia bacterium]|jgi:hypothetical protein|nr:hypothetical protein [Terriglobia bacterium]